MSLRLSLLTLLTLVSSDTGWTVTLRTFGPLRYGMTVIEAERVVGDTLHFQNPRLGEGCDHVDSPSLPAGTSLMVWGDSIIVRVDVSKPGVATRSGIQVGSTEAEVRRVYPARVKAMVNPYDQTSPLLLYTPADAADTAYAIVFETSGGRVIGYRAGRREAVALVEGCS